MIDLTLSRYNWLHLLSEHSNYPVVPRAGVLARTALRTILVDSPLHALSLLKIRRRGPAAQQGPREANNHQLLAATPSAKMCFNRSGHHPG